MKPLFGYLFLAVGISCGIASNSFAKVSEGFLKAYSINFMYRIYDGNDVLYCKSNACSACWFCLW